MTSPPPRQGQARLGRPPSHRTTRWRFGRADPEAFGDLYDRYLDALYRLLFSRLRDRTAAEDVTSDVFFKALRAIDTYRPTGRPFRVWLFRIAVNASIDDVRTRRPAVSLDDAVEQTTDARQTEGDDAHAGDGPAATAMRQSA